MAIQHHPDKNPGKEEAASVKFKEIASAYEILSDTQKRDRYDRFGHADQGQGGGGVNMDHIEPFEIFQAFFGGGMNPDMFQNMGGMNFGGGGMNFGGFGGPGFTFHMGAPAGARRRQQPQSRLGIRVTLEELYKGGKKRVNNDDIEIPRGARDGEVIQGTQSSYVLQEAPHNFYTRVGNDLQFTALVSFYEWLISGRKNFSIAHLDGSVIKVDIKPFTETLMKPSTVISGKGMHSANGAGKLLVYASFLNQQHRQKVMGILRVMGTFFLMMLVMTNPSLLFLVLLLKPIFS